MILFRTPRLIIRTMEEKDFDELFSYRNDESCRRFQRWNYTDKDSIKELISHSGLSGIPTSGNHYYAICTINDNLIGDMFISRKGKTITIGYTISPLHQGHGFATEAVQYTSAYLHKNDPDCEIVAMVDKENLASIRVLEKNDFSCEGYEPQVESLIFSKYTNKKTTPKTNPKNKGLIASDNKSFIASVSGTDNAYRKTFRNAV